MNFRAYLAAVATGLLGLVAADAAFAASYPVLTKTSTTTVTGVYRPLDLNLQMDAIGVSEFFYDPSSMSHQTFALTGQLTGTFSSTYGAFGSAGSWTINLGFNDFNTLGSIRTGSVDSPILDNRVVDSHNISNNTITLRTTASDRPVGTLVYNGGLSLGSGSVALPSDGSDTPSIGDMFLLYAHNAGDVFRVTVDDIANPSEYYLALLQTLLHAGPYFEIDEGLFELDDGSLSGRTVNRVNADCEQGRERCGSVPRDQFFASSLAGDTVRSVPEPTGLILVGLGLVCMVLTRRRLDA
jgi:hypothetical protein